MLDIQNLTVSYGAGNVIHGIDLHVSEGEVVALIGSNGAGKSTILKSISNMVPKRDGEITLNGKSMMKVSPERIIDYGISHVPEGRRVFSDMTVEENLLLGAYRHRKVDSKDLEKIYSLFPILRDRKKQRGGNLSGGEQQMLAIGRALMSKPSFLMLDEPSLGLAPLVVKSVFELIEEIRKEGITILLVEQNLKLALKYADRVYVLQSGEMIFNGTSKELAEKDELIHAYLGTSSLT